MVVKLYQDYLSQPCRAVLIFLNVCKIPIEEHEIALSRGDQLKPDILKLNPSKRVPFIIDTTENDLFVFESNAIMRYIANKYLKPENPYYPRDNIIHQLNIESAMRDYYTKIRPITLPVFIKILAPLQGSESLYNKEQCHEQAKKILKYVDDQLTHRLYITDLNRMTVPDLLFYCEIVQLGIISFDIKKYKNVIDWLNRIGINKHVKNAHWRLREVVMGIDEPSLFNNII